MGKRKEKNNIPIISFGKLNIIYNRYVRGNDYWNVMSLLDHCESKGYPIFEIPIAGLSLSGLPWDISNMDSFVYHMKRVQDTDLKHPIILDDLGQICDGNHRLAKALLKGEKTIKAIRILDMPEPDGHDEQ